MLTGDLATGGFTWTGRHVSQRRDRARVRIDVRAVCLVLAILNR